MSDVNISTADAIRICTKYRCIYEGSLSRKCGYCQMRSMGNIKQMYFYNPPKNDGCDSVNKLYIVLLSNREDIHDIRERSNRWEHHSRRVIKSIA